MKQFSLLTLLPVLSLFLMASTCYMDPPEIYLALDGENNSDYDVWFSCDNPNFLVSDNDVHLAKTERDSGMAHYHQTFFYKVPKHSTSLVFDDIAKEESWVWLKQHHGYPDGLHIYVWKDELIQQVGWVDFVKGCGTEYKYEVEYVLKLDYDLPLTGYTIVYPPSGTSERIKVIYP